jgi:hypothetical protein
LITFHAIEKVIDRRCSHVELITMKVRLPMFRNDTVKDFFNLIIRKVLIRSKGWKFIKPVVDFLPRGAKFTDLFVI